MSTKYKFPDKEAAYFVTSTVVGWADVFTRDIYRTILLNSFKHCQKEQGLQIHAWVLMPNHFHMICSCVNGNDPGMVIKNIKSYTALKLIDAIIKNPAESRREWLLPLFKQHGAHQKKNHIYQFWIHENHPILLGDAAMLSQRMDYLHENPVRAGFVSKPEHWLYSSAIDYYTLNGKGLIDIVSIY